MLHATAPVTVRLDELRVVSTMIDGKGPYHFVLDTGAGITVITPELARRTGLEGSANGQVTGSATVQVRTLTLRDVQVGRAEVRGVAAAIVPLPLDLTYQGDYGRIDGVLDSYVPYKATGVKATRQSSGTFRVIAVIAHSTGAKVGIRAGDVLIAINGDPLGSLSLAQIAEAMTADSVTYLVRSGEHVRRVTLPLFDLLPARYVRTSQIAAGTVGRVCKAVEQQKNRLSLCTGFAVEDVRGPTRTVE